MVADSMESDTTDVRATRQVYTNPIQKLVILDDNIAVGIAGTTPSKTLQHLVSLRGQSIEDVLASLVRYSETWWKDRVSKQFLVAKRAPEPRLWEIVEGCLNDRSSLGTAWIGDVAAFDAFRSRYHGPLKDLDPERAFVAAIQGMIVSGEVDTVGGFVTRVTGDQTAPFRFMGDPVLTGPDFLEATVIDRDGSRYLRFSVPPGSDTTEHMRVSVPGTVPTFSALAHFVPEGGVAWLHTHEKPWERTRIEAKSVDELIVKSGDPHAQFLRPSSPDAPTSLVGVDILVSPNQIADGPLEEGFDDLIGDLGQVNIGGTDDIHMMVEPVECLPVGSVADAGVTRLVLAVLDPESSPIAELVFERLSSERAGDGSMHSEWSDVARLVSAKLSARDEMLSGISLSFPSEFDVAGRDPSVLVKSLEFCAALHTPNRLALPHSASGPHYQIIGEPIATARNEITGAMARSARWIATVQEHLPNQSLAMPRALTQPQAIALKQAAELLSGHAIEGIAQAFSVPLQESDACRVGDSGIFGFVDDIRIELDEHQYIVGRSVLLVSGNILDGNGSSIHVVPADDRTLLATIADTEVMPGSVLFSRVSPRRAKLDTTDVPDK